MRSFASENSSLYCMLHFVSLMESEICCEEKEGERTENKTFMNFFFILKNYDKEPTNAKVSGCIANN